MSPVHHIELRSDNCAGVAPEILAAIQAANSGSALAYGADAITAQLTEVVRDVFQQGEAKVFPVLSGTAANSLALSAMCPPWGSVLCHESAHIFVNEAGATSMFGAGAVMRAFPGAEYKLHPELLQHDLDTARWNDTHTSQPSVLSLTCPTDYGTIYTPAEIGTLGAIAAAHGLRLHLDGARMANALVALNCTAPQLTSEVGVQVFSLGATKNGGLGTDAIVSFDNAVSDQLEYRLKRAGQVASKMRFQSVQLLAYLTDGLWLRLAQRANDAMAALSAGLRKLDVELLAEPQANILFATVERSAIDRLVAQDLLFYKLGGGVVRFVTSFQTTDDDVQEALLRIERALNPG